MPIASRVMRMKDDGRAAHGGPSHGLRIAPAFVTRDDAEAQAVDVEDTPRAVGDIGLVLGWMQLVLRLPAEEAAVGVDDHSGDL